MCWHQLSWHRRQLSRHPGGGAVQPCRLSLAGAFQGSLQVFPERYLIIARTVAAAYRPRGLALAPSQQ